MVLQLQAQNYSLVKKQSSWKVIEKQNWNIFLMSFTCLLSQIQVSIFPIWKREAGMHMKTANRFRVPCNAAKMTQKLVARQIYLAASHLRYGAKIIKMGGLI